MRNVSSAAPAVKLIGSERSPPPNQPPRFAIFAPARTVEKLPISTGAIHAAFRSAANASGRDVARTLEVHVTGHDAYGPAVVDAARIAQIDRHVVVAPFPEALPPADLREVEGVKPPVTRDGVIVGFVLSVIGGGDLRRHQREGCRRGVSV